MTLVTPATIEEVPALRRWTREEYHRMAEVGILREGAGTELIDGQIIQKMPQGKAHALAIKLVFWALFRALGEGYDLSMQMPLPLGDEGEPEPDILVLRGSAQEYGQRDPDPVTDVAFVVEVSDSSLAYDRRGKAALYAFHGVPEYWVVNLRGRCLEISRFPSKEGYAETLVLREGDSVPLGSGWVNVSDVLPPEQPTP